MTISQADIEAVSTPPLSDTRIGELRFADGVPDSETVDTVYGHLDLVRGVDAFLNAFQGVSMLAIRRGFRGAGVFLRCYSPKASFFDKSWRPGEIEPVK
jgi:hypothetical protein